MKLKRILAMVLSVVSLCTLLTVAPVSAAEVPLSGFSDITDATTAQAAELLRLLGVVEGTGGSAYNPEGHLTRAGFCKLAIEIRGEGELAAAQMNRTIFEDVRGDHWARGYINYASSITVGGGESGEKLIMGIGDGTFRPNQDITVAQAVTMTMRLLGYTAADVPAGSAWYDGYMSTARSIGLLKDLEDLDSSAAITRGQAAILFQNLLFTKAKGGSTTYLESQLGGSMTQESILLSVDAVDPATNASGCIQTAEGIYRTDHVAFDTGLVGLRVRLVLDRNDRVLSIEPSSSVSRRTVTVTEAEAVYIVTTEGERLTVSPETPVYQDGKQTTYSAIYMDLRPGSQITAYYNAAGQLEYMFQIKAQAAETAVVAKTLTGGNPFASLVAGESSYRILKNGAPATTADFRLYDVATYDASTRTLNVSDLRLTGIYQDAYPSPKTPLSIKVMGVTFPVLQSAMEDVASFSIGSAFTILLTADGQVAGAVSTSAARSTTVGVVTEISTTAATVEPLSDLRDTEGKKVSFTGAVNYTQNVADQLQGQLVTVSSSRAGELTLTRLSGSGATGTLDVATRTMGGVALADNVRLYERVGNGAPAAISWSQLTLSTVPASSIVYVGRDYADRVNILVLDDVTGDQYSYGIAKVEQITTDYFNGSPVVNTGVSVTGPNAAGPFVAGVSAKTGDYIGIAASLETMGSKSTPRLSKWVSLHAVTGVSRSSFNITQAAAKGSLAPIGTVTTSDMVIPIAGNVVCYNASTKEWFASLDAARAYSDTLTIYYDRSPENGGKVRLVVVE